MRNCAPTCGPDDLYIPHPEIGDEVVVFDRRERRRRHRALQIVQRTEHAAADLVAEVDDLLRHLAVARVSVSPQVQRVLAEQVVFDALHPAVVQVLLALGGIGLERLDDLVLALVQGRSVVSCMSSATSSSLLAGGP